jgi:hypothetical protein
MLAQVCRVVCSFSGLTPAFWARRWTRLQVRWKLSGCSGPPGFTREDPVGHRRPTPRQVLSPTGGEDFEKQLAQAGCHRHKAALAALRGGDAAVHVGSANVNPPPLEVDVLPLQSKHLTASHPEPPRVWCAVQRRRFSVGASPTRQLVAPAGSNQSGRGGDKTAEASGARGRLG